MIKNCLNLSKNHTCRWYYDTQPCKQSCPNSTLFVRYKNNKFLKIVIFISYKWSRVWAGYLQACVIILSTCVIFFVNLDDFFAMIYTDFHEDYGFQHVPFMFSLLFYHCECSDTDSDHRNKSSLNQNHGIYPFWRPAPCNP